MRISLRLCGSVVILCSVLNAQKTSVVTVAGGYQGNHKLALSASFAYPTAVAIDTAGNLYIADSENCEIRKVEKQGFIGVFAGTGLCGFSGDGGKASSAMLSGYFGGMVFDSAGSLLFADSGNARIRKITANGMISTIVGNGTVGYSGDGGPADQAELRLPAGIALDAAGDLYIADNSSNVVRKVNSAGIINTVAGNASAPYGGTFGDGGPATSANIGYVQAVAVDGTGNFYLTDSYAHVRRVDSAGVITTIAGNGQYGNTGDGGPATAAAIGGGEGLLLNGNALYVSTGTSVWWIDLNAGLIHLVAGASSNGGFGGDGGPALSATFSQLLGIALDSSGNLVIADTSNARVRKITAGSQIVTTVAGGYTGNGKKATDASLNFGEGNRLAFDGSGNLYITDTDNNSIRKVSATGIITTVAGSATSGYSGDGGPATAAQLYRPTSVAVDSAGNVFIADTGNGVVRKVDSTGTITTLNVQNNTPFYPFRVNNDAGIAVDSFGNLYVCDGLTVVWKIDPNGNGTIVAGTPWGFGYGGDGGPATQALLLIPAGVAVDAAGNLYIADWLNNRIRRVDTTGIITTIAGNGSQGFSGDGGPAVTAQLSLPEDVVTDSAGNLYIADLINFRIRVVDPAGIINTVVGSGAVGYNGERVPPKQANVLPSAVTLDSAGGIYFSDSSSFRVRKVGK